MFFRAARNAGLSRAHRFSRDRSGSTVVEFALIALPFLALIFAILQTALIFFSTQVLDSGLQDAARLIRTGQAQQQNFSATQFKQAVCGEIHGLLDCENGLVIDVRTWDNFGSADVGLPITDGELDEDFMFDPGGRGDIVVVRAFYEWPVVLPTMNANVANLKNGRFLISSAATFRNEPF